MSSGKYTEICHYISLDFYDQRILYPFSSCAGALSFSFGKEMPPVQLFQLVGGVVRAEPAIDEAARDAPIPAVFVDHAVHDAIDFCLHACHASSHGAFFADRAVDHLL